MTAKGIEQWIDNNHSTMAWMVLVSAVAMLAWVTKWSMAYSNSVEHGTGLDTGAVIAAVQVPVTFYAKWVFEVFAGIIKK